MWYIFPQIQGLGSTHTSEFYSIQDIEEAIEFLNNEILRTRLIEISQALLDLGEIDINEVMGFPDNLKLKSSMTLFREAEKASGIKCDDVFQKVLDQVFKGEEDKKTINILEKQKLEKLKDKKNNILNSKENNNDKKTITKEIDIENKEEKPFDKKNLNVKNLDENKDESNEEDKFICCPNCIII